MSNTKPVETSIQAVSPLSGLGSSAGLAAGGASGASAALRGSPANENKHTARKGIRSRFKMTPSNCAWEERAPPPGRGKLDEWPHKTQVLCQGPRHGEDGA